MVEHSRNTTGMSQREKTEEESDSAAAAEEEEAEHGEESDGLDGGDERPDHGFDNGHREI